MEVLREQMSFLLEQGLYDSAELLGCFLMCAPTANSEIIPSVRAENMVLLADALYGKKEYRRALNMYRQALQQCRVSPKQAMGGTRTPVQSRLPAVNLTHFSNINENEVQCCSCQSLRGVLGIGLWVKLLTFFRFII
jgi:anaphase-promoting complex subunit 7